MSSAGGPGLERQISWIITQTRELILAVIQSWISVDKAAVPPSELCGGGPSSGRAGRGWKINAANWQHLGPPSASFSPLLYQTGSITQAGLHSAALKKQEALSVAAVHVQVCVALWWVQREEGGGGGNSLFASL